MKYELLSNPFIFWSFEATSCFAVDKYNSWNLEPGLNILLLLSAFPFLEGALQYQIQERLEARYFSKACYFLVLTTLRGNLRRWS